MLAGLERLDGYEDVLAVTAPHAVADSFGLVPTDDRSWRATIAPRWMLPDRVFGGYSAALCCAATLAGTELPPTELRLLSATVTFLAAVRPGEIDFEVATVRRGRRVGWFTGTGRQDGRPVISSLLAVAFGSEADGDGAAERVPATSDFEPPDDLSSLEFLHEVWPFVDNFDERAIDYPTSLRNFSDGRSTVSLWIRALDPVFIGDPLSEQLADIAIADAHLLDAVCRATGAPLTEAFSLDLHLVWTDRPAPTRWRRVDIHGERGQRFGPCRAEVLAADGSVRAYASQQGFLG